MIGMSGSAGLMGAEARLDFSSTITADSNSALPSLDIWNKYDIGDATPVVDDNTLWPNDWDDLPYVDLFKGDLSLMADDLCTCGLKCGGLCLVEGSSDLASVDIKQEPNDGTEPVLPPPPIPVTAKQLFGYSDDDDEDILNVCNTSDVLLSSAWSHHQPEVVKPEIKRDCFLSDVGVVGGEGGHTRLASGEPLRPDTPITDDSDLECSNIDRQLGMDMYWRYPSPTPAAPVRREPRTIIEPGQSLLIVNNVNKLSSHSGGTWPASDHSYVSDHSYHHRRKHDDKGLLTPSDSEEEVDVVTTPVPVTPPRPKLVPTRTVKVFQRSGSSKKVGPIKIHISTKEIAFSKDVSTLLKAKLSQQQQQTGTKRAVGPAQVGRPPKKPRYATVRVEPCSSSRSRFSSGDEEDPEKRSLHNNLERIRRNDLRNSLDFLRSLVPETMENERCPKVVILKKAAQYCHHLTRQEDALKLETDRLRKVRDNLEKKLVYLQRRKR